MSGRSRDVRADLEAGASEEIVRLAQRLQDERPVPAAGFRGALRRSLAGGSAHARPRRLHALIAAYASGGALLLVAGALSAAGLGPLAA